MSIQSDRSFHIGELVIMQHASHFTEWNGAPAVVKTELRPSNPMDMNTVTRDSGYYYAVEILVEGAFVVNAKPYQLRKLRDGDPVAKRKKDAGKPVCPSKTGRYRCISVRLR